MKKLFVVIISMCLGQAALTMEQTQKPKLSQRDKLGKKLNIALVSNQLDEAFQYLQQGANVNYAEPDAIISGYLARSPLMNVVRSDSIGLDTKLLWIRRLIDHGAGVNLIAQGGNNALLSSCNQDISELLIQEGADIYHCNRLCLTALFNCIHMSHLRTVKRILELATALGPIEQNSVKNWLLTELKLRKQGLLHFPKDIRIKIALTIIESIAKDLHKQVIHAGGSYDRFGDPVEFAANSVNRGPNGPAILQLLTQYFDLEFLRKFVRKQVAQSFARIGTIELSEDEAFGTWNNESN